MSTRRSRLARLAFEGAPNPLSKSPNLSRTPLEARRRSLFRQIAGRASRTTSGVRPAAAPKGAGASRSEKRRIFGVTSFWPSTALRKRREARARGTGAVGRLGEASKRTLDRLRGRCAAHKRVTLRACEASKFSAEKIVLTARWWPQKTRREPKISVQPAKGSPSTGTRTRN